MTQTNFTPYRIILVNIFSILLASSCAQKTALSPSYNYYSTNVKDSFQIFIDSLSHKDPEKPFNLFIYLDANLNSGIALRSFIKKQELRPEFQNTLFVGIGHIGNYRVKRRRDLTVPQIKGNDTLSRSKNFGQIENFYQFLKFELIPAINVQYPTNKDSNSIFGHSFGGLFATFCLLKNDSLFRNFYALSPSLWVNNSSIYEHENLLQHGETNRKLFLSVGSRETLNRVKPSTDKFYRFMENKHLTYLILNYKIYEGETHTSQVPHSLHDIFR